MEQKLIGNIKEVKKLLVDHNVPRKYWTRIHEAIYKFGSINIDEKHTSILDRHK